MKKEEAIEILNALAWTQGGADREETITAISMAIEALQEPKTIIGIDIPYGSNKGIATFFKDKDDKLILEEVKEVMAVVRCKNCKYCAW